MDLSSSQVNWARMEICSLILPSGKASCHVLPPPARRARLNLVYLQYEQAGMTAVLTMNPVDSRSLVYTQYRDFEDDSWYREQTYDVAPEPATLLMVGWSVACLATWRRQAGRSKEMAKLTFRWDLV